ncbi:hypothetical protein G5I_09738 [Acromyrmex echinatior]|uniref:Uncharacterized protein n=1 Tax=Acromyrmex echinatior TaxID=103372 RepID=F4WV06_ACREC|nr:hypothetical protein G5I_09738 [Acromyrmex echinatior]
MTITLQSALAPLFTIGSFCCLGLFEYPLGQSRLCFSCLKTGSFRIPLNFGAAEEPSVKYPLCQFSRKKSRQRGLPGSMFRLSGAVDSSCGCLNLVFQIGYFPPLVLHYLKDSFQKPYRRPLEKPSRKLVENNP